MQLWRCANSNPFPATHHNAAAAAATGCAAAAADVAEPVVVSACFSPTATHNLRLQQKQQRLCMALPCLRAAAATFSRPVIWVRAAKEAAAVKKAAPPVTRRKCAEEAAETAKSNEATAASSNYSQNAKRHAGFCTASSSSGSSATTVAASPLWLCRKYALRFIWCNSCFYTKLLLPPIFLFLLLLLAGKSTATVVTAESSVRGYCGKSIQRSAQTAWHCKSATTAAERAAAAAGKGGRGLRSDATAAVRSLAERASAAAAGEAAASATAGHRSPLCYLSQPSEKCFYKTAAAGDSVKVKARSHPYESALTAAEAQALPPKFLRTVFRLSPNRVDTAAGTAAAYPTTASAAATPATPPSAVAPYCVSTTETQRLPTRPIVIGRDAAAKPFHELFSYAEHPTFKNECISSPKTLAAAATKAAAAAADVPLLLIGSAFPIAVQTMINCDTRDVDAAVEQIRRCAAAGCSLVRLTTPGLRDVEAAKAIKEKLSQLGLGRIALVADIHFSPRVALVAAEVFEKVRVNPGNFADGVKRWDDEPAASTVAVEAAAAGAAEEPKAAAAFFPPGVAATQGVVKEEAGLAALEREEQRRFEEGYRRIEERLLPLIEKCKAFDTCMRIGTNHGSLSARVLRQYGDTPRGMVESALEFASICRQQNFFNFCFSMKSSNPLVMIQAYRLLASELLLRGPSWLHPLHLGVTESGEGEDGRVRSSIGIGALLQDGIGDTIRVSLTEPPEAEIPVAQVLSRLQQIKLHHHAAGAGPASATSLHYELASQSEPTTIATEQPAETAMLSRVKVPYFEETTRDFQNIEKRAVEEGIPFQQKEQHEQQELKQKPQQRFLHKDGSLILAVKPEALEEPEKLYEALGCGVVAGVPFKGADSPDCIYLSSLLLPEEKERKKDEKARKELAAGEGDSSSLQQQRVARASETLKKLQRAGIGVLASMTELTLLLFARERHRQEQQKLLEKRQKKEDDLRRLSQSQLTEADLEEQREMKRWIQGAVYIQGIAGVMSLRDAAALRGRVFPLVQKQIPGAVLVVDGCEQEEEYDAVADMPHLLFFLLRPSCRLTSGVTATRRFFDYLKKYEKKHQQHQQPTPIWKLPVIHYLDDASLLDAAEADISQGCRMRNTKTEFISCPSCGRTLFDIQAVSAAVKARTGHLPGVTIAVMGCIVNGVGEMADADFGYVGGAPGKIDLYVKKKVVQRGIPSEHACDELIKLIKQHGRWVDPPAKFASPAADLKTAAAASNSTARNPAQATKQATDSSTSTPINQQQAAGNATIQLPSSTAVLFPAIASTRRVT